MAVQYVIAVVIMRLAAVAMEPNAPVCAERDARIPRFPKELDLLLATLVFHVIDGHRFYPLYHAGRNRNSRNGKTARGYFADHRS